MPTSHMPPAPTLYERVESLLFKHPIESPKFSNTTNQNATSIEVRLELPNGPITYTREPHTTSLWPTAPQWSGPQSRDANEEVSISRTTGTESRNRTREVSPAHESDLSQEHIWKASEPRIDLLESLECEHCKHRSNTQSDAKFVSLFLRVARSFIDSIPPGDTCVGTRNLLNVQ